MAASRFAVLAIVVAPVLLFVQSSRGPSRADAAGDARDKPKHGALTRMRITTADGVLVVYDAAPSRGGSRSFAAFWRDDATEMLYVYGRPVTTRVELEAAMSALSRSVGASEETVKALRALIESDGTQEKQLPMVPLGKGDGRRSRGPKSETPNGRNLQVPVGGTSNDSPSASGAAWVLASREAVPAMMGASREAIGGEAEPGDGVGGVAAVIWCPPGGPAARGNGQGSVPVGGTGAGLAPGEEKRRSLNALSVEYLAPSPPGLGPEDWLDGVLLAAGCPPDGDGNPLPPPPPPPDPPCRPTPGQCCNPDCDGCDPTDCDSDGIPDWMDPDINGNGVPNGEDPDSDGDGIPNWDDPSPNGCTDECCGSSDPCCGVTDPCAASPCGDPCSAECVNCDDGDPCTVDSCSYPDGDCSHTCPIGLREDDGAVASDCAKPFAMELRELEFLEDILVYRNAGADGWATGFQYRDRDWMKRGVNPDQPVAYVRDKKMRFKVKVWIQGDGTGNATLRVDGPDGLTGETTVATPCGERVPQPFTFYTTTKLPNVVKKYERMTLTWSAKGPGSETFIPVETTTHNVYVTYAMPVNTRPTPKRLSAVCDWASGSNTIDGVALKVFDWLNRNDPPTFALNTPHPIPWDFLNPWGLMPGGDRPAGDCRDLANLMRHACGVVGIPAFIGYIYATRDDFNYSASENANETMHFNGDTEFLGYYAAGGYNRWESVCAVNGKYYGLKLNIPNNDVNILGSSINLIKHIVCPNLLTTNHQCWGRIINPTTGQVQCDATNVIPVPLPGGCP